MTATIGWIATALAVAGCVCINRRLRAGFVCWIVANGLSWYLHAAADMPSLAFRDVAFTVLAVAGWIALGRTTEEPTTEAAEDAEKGRMR